MHRSVPPNVGAAAGGYGQCSMFYDSVFLFSLSLAVGPVRTLLIILLTLPVGLTAQRPIASATAPVPRAIREIKDVDLRRDLFAMASPSMRGREGGTLDEMRASMWVAEQYRRSGLTPAGDEGTWFQWFNIVRTRVSLTSSRATTAGQPLTLFRDIIPLSAAPVEATGPVLWLADP